MAVFKENNEPSVSVSMVESDISRWENRRKENKRAQNVCLSHYPLIWVLVTKWVLVLTWI